ncbi:FAD-dependent oxidoreductase [Paraglaciecola aquimarina]|uniref:FAD-dependent oxidoreductase n=1 Tax=Paraglaciecola aquimarina TaxID=1235557 RepID=A0ABU3SZ66_9ALTE|nr:FAD-dependent oxidoreductase [Paraglaciecola aquimarina]MDU0355297.1 FAD-dependent oxidoreductase [Paraglaciecola aquimarina]
MLAHGLGTPVENASTKIDIPKSGVWTVFVRTKDWCPGNWPAPGQFNVHINGQTLANTLGTQKGWAWQNAGSLKLDKGQVSIEVEDLTGFDGRFDAIYITQEMAPELPNSSKDLFNWKDQMAGRSQLTIEEKSFDLVICGGGISGCAAALAADSQGINVSLIQDRPVFGGNASDEIRVHTEGIHGKSEKILKSIDTEHYPNGHKNAVYDQQKREQSMANSNVNLFAEHIVIGLEKHGNTIKSVDARNVRTGIITRFKASQFIDSTGDGWLGFWAGAETRYGREAKSEFDEGWDLHGDLWSPEQPDNKVMGTSLLWNSDYGRKPSSFPKVPWAMDVAGKDYALEGDWDWEYSNDKLNQITDAETIRDHMLRAIFGNFYNAKKRPKNKLVELKFIAFIGGRRESRRIMGDYIYSQNDAINKPDFPDIVVEEKRALDSHYQLKDHGHHADYRSEALFRKVGMYYIPFRCFYSKDISNLMMAGRNFSCTHIGLAGPRVMNTCGQMGSPQDTPLLCVLNTVLIHGK